MGIKTNGAVANSVLQVGGALSLPVIRLTGSSMNLDVNVFFDKIFKRNNQLNDIKMKLIKQNIPIVILFGIIILIIIVRIYNLELYDELARGLNEDIQDVFFSSDAN